MPLRAQQEIVVRLLQLREGREKLPGLRGGGVPRAVHVDVHHPRTEALMVLAPLPRSESDLMVDNVKSRHSCLQ